MDSVDKRILTVLRDGKPWDFHQFLREAGFPQNTLRLHPTSLKRQSFILETKNHEESPGSPGARASSGPRSAVAPCRTAGHAFTGERALEAELRVCERQYPEKSESLYGDYTKNRQ
jgi:hypothetical protein